jgi:hypothetical protein
MSGINEIKKKAKLSIEEMYDNQSVGKMEKHEEIFKRNQKTKQEGNKPESKTKPQKTLQQNNQSEIHIGKMNSFIDSENAENLTKYRNEYQTTSCSPLISTPKQQAPKLPTYKMTFTLTEEIYKAFNDLYAKRILQGRKTDKSELICEAIEWLIKIEENQNIFY